MLRYLLNFWLFPMFGLMFAAGATMDAGLGSGGGDGAGDSGGTGDGGGDSSDGAEGDSSSDTDGAEGDLSADESGSDGSDDATGDTADPDAPVDIGDGRQVPGKFKKLFDLAAKAGLGKEAKQLYFSQQRLAKAIPGGINAAIEMARTVEELGGLDGIQDLQSNLESHTADSEMFTRADPKWVESGFQENPESALKLFVHSLDYVAEHHPENYDHLMAKVIMNDLGSLPVREIYDLLAGMKDNPNAARAAKALADYYNSRLETSRKAPEKKVDAQSKALTERETNVKKQEMNVRYQQVNAEVFPSLKAEVTKTLRAEAKAAGLDLDKLSKAYPAEWRNMLNEIHQEIMKGAQKDQRFLDKYYALVEKGDLKRAAKAVNDKHADIAADATRRVMSTYGVFRGKKGGKPNADKGDKGGAQGGQQQQQQQNQGWARVSKRPENSQINWSKTTSAMQLDGKYILNDGKKVVVQY